MSSLDSRKFRDVSVVDDVEAEVDFVGIVLSHFFLKCGDELFSQRLDQVLGSGLRGDGQLFTIGIECGAICVGREVGWLNGSGMFGDELRFFLAALVRPAI
jgi:hypothetical protein